MVIHLFLSFIILHHGRDFLQNFLLSCRGECSVMIVNVVVFDDIVNTKTYFHFASELVLEFMFGTKDWLSDKAE
jgi:fumarate reductase subunit C